MKETTMISSFEAWILKLPLMSVMVPTVVFLIKTFAPGIGDPSEAETTVPVISRLGDCNNLLLLALALFMVNDVSTIKHSNTDNNFLRDFFCKKSGFVGVFFIRINI